MWYLTMDQVLDYQWKIDYDLENPGGGNFINTIQDEEYVFKHIMMDHEKIDYMSKETQFVANRYAFVSDKDVHFYLAGKLNFNREEGQVEVLKTYDYLKELNAKREQDAKEKKEK